MFSSATQPPRPPPCHNFVVSAITFEGFKLHPSNLTHALLIQIYRTSLIIDIVVPSKMAAGGHFVNILKVAYRSEMARNAIKRLFSDNQNGRRRPFCQNKFKKEVSYGSEMARNAIKSEFRTSKMANRSEMAKNAIQSDFLISKITAEKTNRS